MTPMKIQLEPENKAKTSLMSWKEGGKTVNSDTVSISFVSKDIKALKEIKTHESWENRVPADLYCKHASNGIKANR